jgi:hypothetical protein
LLNASPTSLETAPTASFVASSESTSAGNCQVSGEEIYMHACPDPVCATITQIPEGSQLTILSLAILDEWLPVQYGEYLGWVSSGSCLIQPK